MINIERSGSTSDGFLMRSGPETQHYNTVSEAAGVQFKDFWTNPETGRRASDLAASAQFPLWLSRGVPDRRLLDAHLRAAVAHHAGYGVLSEADVANILSGDESHGTVSFDYTAMQDLAAGLAADSNVLVEGLGSIGIAHVILGDFQAALAVADVLDTLDDISFDGDEIRAAALLGLGDLEGARSIIRSHAADALTGRLTRKANNTLLLLTLLAGYPMNRIIRSAVGVIASAALVAVALPSPASAAKPFVFDEGQFSEDFVIPAEFSPCDFDIRIQETVSLKVTVFFDKNGDPRQATVHNLGTTQWGLPGEEAVVTEHWVNTVFLELAPDSTPDTPPLGVTVVGNLWNAHAGAGGVLVNDSGRIVFDENEDVVSGSGPHEAFFGEFDDFCATILAG